MGNNIIVEDGLVLNSVGLTLSGRDSRLLVGGSQLLIGATAKFTSFDYMTEFRSTALKTEGLSVFNVSNKDKSCEFFVDSRVVGTVINWLGDKILFPKGNFDLRIVENGRIINKHTSANLQMSLSPEERHVIHAILPYMRVGSDYCRDSIGIV